MLPHWNSSVAIAEMNRRDQLATAARERGTAGPLPVPTAGRRRSAVFAGVLGAAIAALRGTRHASRNPTVSGAVSRLTGRNAG